MTVGLSPVSVNTRIKSLRTMFKWLKIEGLISINPLENVKKVREPGREIQIMNNEQLKSLISAPNQRTYSGFRDYVMMNLLIDSFMRIGEVIALKRKQIDFDSGLINLSSKETKSRRARIVPLSRKTLDLLRELLAESAEFESEFVFLTNYGEVMTDDQFRRRLKEHAKKAGIEIRIYPHLFRHTAATMFLEDGGDIRHLQKIIGHADLRMVEHYTHLSSKSIKAQHEQYSPMNRLQSKLNMPRKTLR